MELAVLSALLLAALLCTQVDTSSAAFVATSSVATASVAASTAALDRLELLPEGISSDELANRMIMGTRRIGPQVLDFKMSSVPEAAAMLHEAKVSMLRGGLWMGSWILSGIGLSLALAFVDPTRTETVRVPGLAPDALGGVAVVERLNPIVAIPVLLGIVNVVSSVVALTEFWNSLRAKRDAIDLYNRAVVLEGGAL